MLTLRRITKVYRTTEIETAALSDVDLDIGTGDFLAVMGPSGCGKSTLLNLIGMLDSPTSGTYSFFGEQVAGWPERKLAVLRRLNVGFIFQGFNLISDLTVFENAEVPLIYARLPSAERAKRVDAVLETVGMAPRRNHFPQQLSGGQQQRVAIARAIVSNPKLILADEPTGNLDSANGLEIMKLLVDLNGYGTTVVMVTHSHALAAHAARTVRMVDGRVVHHATPEMPSEEQGV